MRPSVPRLLINRDRVGPFAGRRSPHDVVQLGDVVSGVQALVQALGWTQELEALMAAAAEKVSYDFLLTSSHFFMSPVCVALHSGPCMLNQITITVEALKNQNNELNKLSDTSLCDPFYITQDNFISYLYQ